jgi:hypothetical protein
MRDTLLTLVILVYKFTLGQEAIIVTEQSIKIGPSRTETFYFGFAEGDVIRISLVELNGKEIQEFEVLEYSSISKLTEFKVAEVKDKTITVQRTGIYAFRIYNGSPLGGRVCKLKLERIPKSVETQNFNTAVLWIDKQDTTWHSYTKEVLIDYDTIYVQKTKKVLDTTILYQESVIEKTERVHSTTNANGNTSIIFFTLPKGTTTTYNTKKVISWAYYVGVGNESQAAYQKDNSALTNLVTNWIGMYSPLAALAVGTLAELTIPTTGDNIKYSLVDTENKNNFQNKLPYKSYDFGDGIAGYKKFTSPMLLNGTYYVILQNDNSFEGIDVHVKVVAIMEEKKYSDKSYTEMVVKPTYEKQIFTDPVIKTRSIPILAN